MSGTSRERPGDAGKEPSTHLLTERFNACFACAGMESECHRVPSSSHGSRPEHGAPGPSPALHRGQQPGWYRTGDRDGTGMGTGMDSKLGTGMGTGVDTGLGTRMGPDWAPGWVPGFGMLPFHERRASEMSQSSKARGRRGDGLKC